MQINNCKITNQVVSSSLNLLSRDQVVTFLEFIFPVEYQLF